MPLSAGARLGPYEILSSLGAGGMGEVYKARDSKLNRSVAIKVLLPAVAGDPDRVARFRREAQLLAALNHHNIGAIYGFEDSGAVHALVMELVDGPTLADRIAQGPLPVDEALSIARQIAQALEAAHDCGIVHRDLKPANVKLRVDGTVKVLDFGLAKAFDVSAGEIGAENPQTITSPAMTAMGVILGTAAYMSPEQAKGRPVDKRSDVWAFGCVLYEMLTGVRPFDGGDVSDMLASVLKTEPDWNLLPTALPSQARALIRGCLEKERRDRIGDLSTAIFLLRPQQLFATPAPPRSARWKVAAGLAAGAIGGVAAVLALVPKHSPEPRPVSRFAIVLPADQHLTLPRTAVAISPDGSRIVYAADGRLYLHALSEFEARSIAGVEQGIHPVFSPDGQSVVFWADGFLKRISIAGGTPVTVAEVGTAPSGITWHGDAILFGLAGIGVLRVSAAGGKPETLVAMRRLGEGDVHGPQLLPGGEWLLFTLGNRAGRAVNDPWQNASIVVQSLKTGERRTLVEGATDGRYVPTGHIVFAVAGTVFAVPFDAGRLTVGGNRVPIVEGVRRAATAVTGGMHMAFSDTGTFVYAPGPVERDALAIMLFDRQGHAEPLKLAAGSYGYPRVSPDGKRVAFETYERSDTQVAIYELSGGSSLRRLTFGGNNRFPIWSPDGARVAFQSDREGDVAVFWQSADGGVAERLTRPERGVAHVPESWSHDGKTLLVGTAKESERSLLVFSMRDRKAVPFSDVKSLVFPTDAVFSPDGNWVAYQAGSTAAGDATTFVEPFPPNGSKYQIARGGRPAWSRDGRELFFVPAPAQFQVVTVTTRPAFSFTPSVRLPRTFGVADPANPRPYDILPDGRFIGLAPSTQTQNGASELGQLRVVVNWFEELKLRALAK